MGKSAKNTASTTKEHNTEREITGRYRRKTQQKNTA